MKIVNLYWDNKKTGCIVVIENDDVDEETLKKIVEEYKKSNPRLYNVYDCIQYMMKKGIKVITKISYDSSSPVYFFEKDYEIYF